MFKDFSIRGPGRRLYLFAQASYSGDPNIVQRICLLKAPRSEPPHVPTKPILIPTAVDQKFVNGMFKVSRSGSRRVSTKPVILLTTEASKYVNVFLQDPDVRGTSSSDQVAPHPSSVGPKFSKLIVFVFKDPKSEALVLPIKSLIIYLRWPQNFPMEFIVHGPKVTVTTLLRNYFLPGSTPDPQPRSAIRGQICL